MSLHLVSNALLKPTSPRPVAKFKRGTKLLEHMKIVEQGENRTVVEFINTDAFNAAWYNRQRYEVDAGRDEEPILYEPLYDITEDPDLPRNVPIYRLGPAAVIFEEVKEGGEVKFATVGQSNLSIPIAHHAVGLEYNKDLLIFNELWAVSDFERQVGTAYNALLNYLHFAPILSFAYPSANQTAASAIGSTLAEKYLRTLEDAIVAAVGDTANPRRGPYYIVCNTGNFFTLKRALQGGVPQQGFTLESDAISQIRGIIAYDGWSGQRGKKTVTYSGVTANKCYLVDIGRKTRNFKSYVKQGLESASGNEDVSRFILEQVVFDTYRGLYADPIAAVEEVSLPTS